MQVILDVGSGNTCRNDPYICKRMVDEIARVDNHRHEIILKAQLFRDRPPNERLKRNVFAYWYGYAKDMGYSMTASVFDLESLKFLLSFKNIPFVKIANDRSLDWLIGEIPRKIPVYQSVGSWEEYGNIDNSSNVARLACVSEYPAMSSDYEKAFDELIPYGLSDHTIGLDLAKEHRPQIYECHFALEDSTGLDAGPWAKRPEELRRLLEWA